MAYGQHCDGQQGGRSMIADSDMILAAIIAQAKKIAEEAEVTKNSKKKPAFRGR